MKVHTGARDSRRKLLELAGPRTMAKVLVRAV